MTHLPLRRSKSEGDLPSGSSSPPRAPPPAPQIAQSSAPVDQCDSVVGRAKQCRPRQALEQWSALADREGHPAYEIQSFALTEKNRRKVCQWAYNISDHTDVDRRVVGILLAYLDRYISRARYSSRRDLDLAIAACFQLAISLHANSGEMSLQPALRFLRSRNQFSKRQLAAKEVHICTVLGWYLNPPVACDFLEVALPLIRKIVTNDGDDVHHLSRFLVELSVYDPFLSSERPSSVAQAAVLVALNYYVVPTKEINHWMSLTLQHNVTNTNRCVRRLQNLLVDNESQIVRLSCSSPTNVVESLDGL